MLFDAVIKIKNYAQAGAYRLRACVAAPVPFLPVYELPSFLWARAACQLYRPDS